MKKPYINISPRFDPIIYCSKKHGRSSAIIHITDYYTPCPEFYMHTWSKVKGYLHIAFNENETGEGSYTKEMANQIAAFVKKMAIKNVPTIFIAFTFNDEEKAKSIGYAIVKTFYNTVNT
ncbi:MAG: hypothetical protein E7555_03715, partial [Ruminococcaceae bacterium]|nr:hypothetical protein [Oscillospiraceae bacterium]